MDEDHTPLTPAQHFAGIALKVLLEHWCTTARDPSSGYTIFWPDADLVCEINSTAQHFGSDLAERTTE